MFSTHDSRSYDCNTFDTQMFLGWRGGEGGGWLHLKRSRKFSVFKNTCSQDPYEERFASVKKRIL